MCYKLPIIHPSMQNSLPADGGGTARPIDRPGGWGLRIPRGSASARTGDKL